jgi:hypothetical protein
LKREALIPLWGLAVLKACLFDTQDNLIFSLYFALDRTTALSSLVRLVLLINFRGFLVAQS